MFWTFFQNAGSPLCFRFTTNTVKSKPKANKKPTQLDFTPSYDCFRRSGCLQLEEVSSETLYTVANLYCRPTSLSFSLRSVHAVSVKDSSISVIVTETTCSSYRSDCLFFFFFFLIVTFFNNLYDIATWRIFFF